MKFRILFTFLFALLLVETTAQVQPPGSEASQTDLTPKYSNEFLAIGVGARSFGMSNAYVASADGVTSGYWNPSGLVRMEDDIQVSAMHSEYFAGIANYDYVGIAKKLENDQAVALSVIRFGVDNILNTTELIDNEGNVDYDRIELFSAADYAFLLSYAKKSKIEGLNIGANAKVIYRQVGDFANSFGFGIDVGGQYKYEDWHFGAMLRDVTTTFNAWKYTLDDSVIETFEETGNEIPENDIELTLPSFQLGAARGFEWNKVTLLAEADINITTDGRRQALITSESVSFYPRLGFEVGYENTIFLRGGVGNFQNEIDFDDRDFVSFQPNIGVGLRIRNFFIDYALSDLGDQSAALYSNLVSVRMNLDRK